nr:MAG TPA: C2H2 type zinc-finger protein [Caudoviricetes sp.]
MHKYTTQHRCCVCHKLLAQSHNLRGRLEIKCPRRKRVAVFNNPECREHPALQGHNGCTNSTYTNHR